MSPAYAIPSELLQPPGPSTSIHNEPFSGHEPPWPLVTSEMTYAREGAAALRKDPSWTTDGALGPEREFNKHNIHYP